jgi:hypothetical protein
MSHWKLNGNGFRRMKVATLVRLGPVLIRSRLSGRWGGRGRGEGGHEFGAHIPEDLTVSRQPDDTSQANHGLEFTPLRLSGDRKPSL